MPLKEWILLTESVGFRCEFDRNIDGPLKYINAYKTTMGDWKFNFDMIILIVNKKLWSRY